VATALAVDTEEGAAARERLAHERSIHVPHLLDVEVVSVLRRRAAARELREERVSRALVDLMDLSLMRHRHVPFAYRMWELRHNLTPYDAVYVALAESLGCPLVTADRALARAPGPGCEVEMLRTS
jgi:predicted nucleic acid-binding protein